VKVCDTESYCMTEQKIVDSGKYVSPINTNNQCESNHIILFTDGAPSGNDEPGNQGFVNCGKKGSYACQKEIASYLIDDDNHIKKEVKTHNIGLYMAGNKANMEAVSNEGEGSTINADSPESLLNAFLQNMDLIDEQSRSIAAPGVAVNTLN